MNKLLKNVASKILALTVVAQLVLPSVALAGLTAECSNNTTQGWSTNLCDSRISQRIEIFNSNSADVENYIDLGANTGSNTITEVNGDVDYTSGDIDVEYSVENELNFNETTLDLGGDDIEVITENNTTQSDSENIAVGNVEVDVSIENGNELNVENTVIELLDTGNNDILEVNGDVDGQSGSIESDGEISTEGNHNTTEVEGVGDIELEARNEMTQSGSINVADSSADVSLYIENWNETSVENYVEALAYSGDNDLAEVNGDVDKWNSGDVTVDVEVANGADDGLGVNDTVVDHWADSISVITENNTTQGWSDNIALGEVAMALEIINYNGFEIDNELFLFGDSGLNDVVEVNGDVDFESGELDLSSDIANDGNVNFTEVDGSGDLEAFAANRMTQSDSYNYADSFIGWALLVDNYNWAEVDNIAAVLGFSSENLVLEVNGDLDFVTGDVTLKDDADTTANFNTTEVSNGPGDNTAEAENEETQSGSVNEAYAVIDRNGVENGDDAVFNVNELDLDNELVEFGDTGWNEILEVNGDIDFETGEVDESSDVTSDGNYNETEL